MIIMNKRKDFMPALKSLLIISAITLSGCISNDSEQNSENKQGNKITFENASNDITLEKFNRRKWDNPVIADFDQDGNTDIILMDHGRLLRLHWNNGKGGFLPPVVIRGGDLHGIAVGDFNQNGNINLVVAQGGGAGTNLRAPEFYEISKNRKIVKMENADKGFIKGRGRGAKFVDADNDGDLDLILPGVLGSKEDASQIFVYENKGKGQYQLHSKLPRIKGEAQRLKITDFNNDNILDLIFYGSEQNIRLFQGKGDLNFTNVTKQVFNGQSINLVTGIAEIDYDNDGDFDLYITRSGELTKRKQYVHYNEHDHSIAIGVRGKRIVDIKDIQAGENLNIKNFQKVMKKKVYLGVNKKLLSLTGDWHAGVDLNIDANDAAGFPAKDQLEEDSLHIGYLGNGKWRLSASMHFLGTLALTDVSTEQQIEIPLDVHADILLENNNGIFQDATKKAALYNQLNTTGVAVGDYNNDGLSDLFVVKHGDMTGKVKQILYVNNGIGQFKVASSHSITSKGLATFGMGADTLDYNNDGKLDLAYCDERGLWQLYKNSTVASATTQYIKIRVANSPSGKATALGALVTIVVDGKKQTKRIGYTAAPYSQSFDNTAHFGLASNSKVDEVNIRWSNGESNSATMLKGNRSHNLPLTN